MASSCLSHGDLSDYVNGTASADRIASIIRHIECCNTCHQDVVSMVRASRPSMREPVTVEDWLAQRAARRRR